MYSTHVCRNAWRQDTTQKLDLASTTCLSFGLVGAMVGCTRTVLALLVALVLEGVVQCYRLLVMQAISLERKQHTAHPPCLSVIQTRGECFLHFLDPLLHLWVDGKKEVLLHFFGGSHNCSCSCSCCIDEVWCPVPLTSSIYIVQYLSTIFIRYSPRI